jgi:glycosyltransferase involved in cell wall biosynthesis
VKILVLTPTFLPVVGGAEMVLFEVYRRLAPRHDVLLLTPVRPRALLAEQASPEYDSLTPFPVERYSDRVSFMSIRGHRVTFGALPPFSLSAVSAIGRAIRRFQPDVANVHYLMPTGLAALAAELWLGVPTVVTMNGRDAPGPGVPPLWRWWQRALLALLSDVTYVSGYCRRAIYGDASDRGHVIYNGVDIARSSVDPGAVRRALGVGADEPLIFALQRLAPEKRVDVLLHALRRCRDRIGTGTLVIGGTGPEAPRLATLARQLGIENQTRFTGYIPRAELPGYFLAADVFAFHSTFETFGLVVAQAMGYGRPVVTVANTALPEVVGDAAVLVPTGQAEAFGDAIADLIKDDGRRRRLGEAGRARATALFDWDRIAAQYEAVLVRAAGGPRRARPLVATVGGTW